EEGMDEGIVQHKLFSIGPLESFIEPLNRWKRVREIRALAKEIGADIVHAHDLSKYGEYAYLCGARPYIITNWGMTDIYYVANYFYFFKKELRGKRRKIRQAAFQEAAYTTALVAHTQDVISKEFGVPPEKIPAFPWGVDLDLFHKGYEKEVAALRKELGIPSGNKIILSSRHMDPYYNIENIIKACAIAMKKRNDITLILRRAGGLVSYESKLKTIVKELGIESNTRFLSEYLPFEQMPIQYNLADVSVMIPRTDQGALSVHETMACGAVVIASDIEGNREMIRNGENGFLVDPDNTEALASAIVKALDPELKGKAYEANWKWIKENADWKKNAKRMEDLYLTAIKGERGRN
ncbi:MAG: glycosyltransferase family 4 protein, partial [Thermoplasmata archaeon]|nr:glycosyltransferase family 4 protein [Thermoplasmata archaeon]